MRAKVCTMCLTDSPIHNEELCGACDEYIENLWAAGWKLIPPAIRETTTRRAATYRRYGSKQTVSSL